jgi:hypothetical protein
VNELKTRKHSCSRLPVIDRIRCAGERVNTADDGSWTQHYAMQREMFEKARNAPRPTPPKKLVYWHVWFRSLQTLFGYILFIRCVQRDAFASL